MKNKSIQILVTDQQEKIILKAIRILENRAGETLSRSEGAKRLTFEKAKEFLKEEKEE